MKAITVLKINYLQNYILEIEFSDGCVKRFDFAELITFNGIAESLKDISFFKNIDITDDGRSFSWANGYDCCADWARYYAKDLDDEWKGTDETIGLKQRIIEAHIRIQRKRNLDHVA